MLDAVLDLLPFQALHERAKLAQKAKKKQPAAAKAASTGNHSAAAGKHGKPAASSPLKTVIDTVAMDCVSIGGYRK